MGVKRMKVEHRLAPAASAYARATVKELDALRQRYLAALGAAFELKQQADLLRGALSQHLQLIAEGEDLPATIAPYALSADCALLCGETRDLTVAEIDGARELAG